MVDSPDADGADLVRLDQRDLGERAELTGEDRRRSQRRLPPPAMTMRRRGRRRGHRLIRCAADARAAAAPCARVERGERACAGAGRCAAARAGIAKDVIVEHRRPGRFLGRRPVRAG